MPTTKWTLPLTHHREVARGTLEFGFDRPEDLSFKAGQFMEVGLIDPPETDDEGNSRAFSINTAPNDAELLFTTRLRDSAFKRVLKTLPLGSEMTIEGPFGDLTLHKNVRRPAILVSGGIGITPFRSISRWAASQQLEHHIVLIDANKTPADAPFVAEMRQLGDKNERFEYVPIMTNIGPDDRWDGESGMLDADFLKQHIPATDGGESPICYLAGPPGMVAAIRPMLIAAGLDEDDIRTEEFAGY